MNNVQFFLYLLVLAGSTYLIRALPFALLKRKIENNFIRSFLTYIPYAVLTVMTIPAIFYAPGDIPAAVAGLIVAIILALFDRSLIVVAVAASLAVFIFL